MKKETWVLILSIFVLASWRYKPVSHKLPLATPVDTLTAADRSNYLLTIGHVKTSQLKDTVANYMDTVFDSNHVMKGLRPKSKNCYVASIPVKLSNNSGDTLKYINWNCSRNEIYHTDNKRVVPLEEVCYKNGPQVVVLLPHSSSVSNIKMLFDKDKAVSMYTFRIAISLFKGDNNAHLDTFFQHSMALKYGRRYLIWSNQETIIQPSTQLLENPWRNPHNDTIALVKRADLNKIDTLNRWNYIFSDKNKSKPGDSVQLLGKVTFYRVKPLYDSTSLRIYNRNWSPSITYYIYNLSDSAYCYKESLQTKILSSCVPPDVGGNHFIIGKYIFVNFDVCLNCSKPDDRKEYCRPLVGYVISKIDKNKTATLKDIFSQFVIKRGNRK